MKVMSRLAGAVAVLFLIAGSGCGGNLDSNATNNNSHLACQRSVAELCAYFSGSGCPLTWDDVESGQAACLMLSANLVPDTFVVGDCGAYRKLLYLESDIGVGFYYDATSGQLVAIVGSGPQPGERGCGGGPAEGFTVPSCPTVDAAWTRLTCPDAGGV